MMIIFDFDGVLADTFEFHRTKVLEFTGYPLTPEEYREIHMGNFFGHSVQGLEGVDWLGYRDFLKRHFHEVVVTEETKATLQDLAKEHQMSIVTSGGEEIIGECLLRGGVRDLFSDLLGAETHRSKVEKFRMILARHTLETKDCMFVTDTLGDILEANETGIKTVAVDFGFHPRETLERGNPYRIISEFEKLSEIIPEAQEYA